MIEGDGEYYLDLDYLSEFCSVRVNTPADEEDEEDEEFDEEEKKPQTVTTGIDVFKYEIIKMCLDKLLFTGENRDAESDFLLKKDDESTASYALAHNTLLVHKLIKKYEGKY